MFPSIHETQLGGVQDLPVVLWCSRRQNNTCLVVGEDPGVTIELVLFSIPAIVYLATCESVFGHDHFSTDLLLVGDGISPTAIPYVLFSAAAQHISMTLLGVLQYIQPAGPFFIGIFMYHESFSTPSSLVSLSCGSHSSSSRSKVSSPTNSRHRQPTPCFHGQ
ncbi:Aste57867_14079 [Aphanomyces stellatus]|uniref:Aste57867_14079 protein n=1 Tax=Aphanomyces stellatus TaxID=120398 RepID=A0A485KZS1_9STRA|nr:hypothetical protein As57867_014028 [Aphanomyces stellatus]VFT90907.1 Aste57867_14079 [Aphanomyces stellatus]